MSIMCALLLTAALCQASDVAPPARTVDTVDRIYGLTLPDPYRWMEGENNPEFLTWLKAQGARTRAELDASPIHARWTERLKNAGNAGRLHRLQRPMAGRIFFLREDNGKEGVLMGRDAAGRERMLLDPNAVTDKSGHGSITEYSVSPDGKLVAVNVDRGGSEITRIEVVDVDTGTMRADIVEPVWSEFSASWLSDSSGFTYTQLAPKAEQTAGDLLQNERVRLHRLGTPAERDALVLKSGLNATIPFETRELPRVDASAPSDWVIAQMVGALLEQRVCIVKKADVFRPSPSWGCIADYADGVQGAELHDSTLYLMSVKGAPNGRVLAIDLGKGEPSRASARTVVAESPGAVITAILSARDALYVRQMKNGLDSLTRIPHGSTKAQPIAMPFEGAAYLLAADPRADGLVFTLQGWTRPRTAFRFDPASGKLVDLNLGATAPADYSDIQAIETEATSADGTRVPLSIIMPRNLAHDGKALAILDGYGGYGISQQPYFDPMALEWVKAGHIYAVAHVRGGGEKGNAWRLGAKGALKYKGAEDFIGCARTREIEAHGRAAHRRSWRERGRHSHRRLHHARTRAIRGRGDHGRHAQHLSPARRPQRCESDRGTG
jgi:prolyl oligopeptidase